MKINCIIIEDEPLAVKKLAGFIKKIDYLNLLCEFNNAIDAISYLKSNQVDLIFLDIRMKKLSGIKFLESLREKPRIIITSAYDRYALKGYELDVSDYLLKPFSFERFLKSVEKVFSELNKILDDNTNKYIFLKTEYRIEKVELIHILYIQGMKDYLKVVTSDKKIMTLLSFKNIMYLLPDSEFIRVHNSYIVALSKIENIERNRIRISNQLIPISDTYKDHFYDLLRDRKYLI